LKEGNIQRKENTVWCGKEGNVLPVTDTKVGVGVQVVVTVIMLMTVVSGPAVSVAVTVVVSVSVSVAVWAAASPARVVIRPGRRSERRIVAGWFGDAEARVFALKAG
jgi:hypothetical protein